MAPIRPTKEGPTQGQNDTFQSEKPASPTKKSGRPPNKRKKKRPEVHVLFRNRGRRALFHAERGFIHCYHLEHPELSLPDLAATFTITTGQVQGIINTSITSFEEFEISNRGRSATHAVKIETRMAELERIREPGKSSYTLAAEMTSNGFPCSPNTVRSDLWDLGIRCRQIVVSPWVGPKGEDEWKRKRYEFCKEVRKLKAENIVFSDESIIRCTQNKGTCWIKPGTEKVLHKQSNRWAANCHVWAAIGQNGFLSWIDVTGDALTKDDYVEHLRTGFCAAYHRQRDRYPNTVFMQDGASIHRAAVAELEKHWVNILPNWPPHSPDLNPIENLWANMKRELGEEIGRDLSQSKANKERIKGLVGQWLDNLGRNRKDTINKLVSSFRDRVEECYRNKGELTKY